MAPELKTKKKKKKDKIKGKLRKFFKLSGKKKNNFRYS